MDLLMQHDRPNKSDPRLIWLATCLAIAVAIIYVVQGVSLHS